VRRGPREGTLLDASPEREFIAALLAMIHAGADLTQDGKRLEFRATQAFAAQPAPEVAAVNAGEREQSNTTVIADQAYVVKILRRITAGTHPEIEVGRFLADVAHFQNAPTLLGSLELVEGEQRSALAVVHSFIENQGDAWSVTAAALDRLMDEQRLVPAEAAFDTSESAALLMQRIRQIGRRTAEMHLAFACDDKDPAFAPEPVAREDIDRWSGAILARAHTALAAIERRLRDLPEATAELARRVLAAQPSIVFEIEEARRMQPGGMKIRHHGDFHLGQVLMAKEDAYILDFEGEPRRTLEERRQKAPAARDVAGFLRSIDYAASAALDRAPNLKPEEHEMLAAQVRSSSERLGGAYWETYRETLGDAALWPSDADTQRRLLDMFLLEKALYEIEYELTNRPAWAAIPMDATLRILNERGVTA
jgi:maltose alpha-D-glucosyltransferase/alpha-amylase